MQKLLIISFCLLLAIFGASATPPKLLSPPRGGRILEDVQLQNLIVGAEIIGPRVYDGRPEETRYNKNGGAISQKYGVIFSITEGRYEIRHRQLCTKFLELYECVYMAKMNSGKYLIALNTSKGWQWFSVKVRKGRY